MCNANSVNCALKLTTLNKYWSILSFCYFLHMKLGCFDLKTYPSSINIQRCQQKAGNRSIIHTGFKSHCWAFKSICTRMIILFWCTNWMKIIKVNSKVYNKTNIDFRFRWIRGYISLTENTYSPRKLGEYVFSVREI